MAGFIDAVCPQCKGKVGWFGTFMDRPPCPKCKHQYSRAELEKHERAFQNVVARAFAKRMRGRPHKHRSHLKSQYFK